MTIFKFHGLLLSFGVLAFGLFASSSPEDPVATPSGLNYEKQIYPVLKEFCQGCHSGDSASAGLDFSKYAKVTTVLKDREHWERISRNISSGLMPPEGAAQPTKAQREIVLQWIGDSLAAECKLDDPGKVTIRRLNRAEYNNSIRDLFGIDIRPADDFPSDDVGYGFDNISDVLTISPLLMEKYLEAAEKVVTQAIVVPGPKEKRYESENLPEMEGSNAGDSGERIMFTNSEMAASHNFSMTGAYVIKARAWGQQAGPEPCKMAFLLDGKLIQTVEVKATVAAPVIYEVPVNATAGAHKVSVAFTNDFYNPQATDPGQRDRNLVVDYIEVAGPIGSGELPESHRRVIFEQPTTTNRKEVTKKIVEKFALKAFRRPVKPQEIERYLRLAELAEKNGEPFEKGVQLAVQTMLVSPNFLFRAELDPKAGKGKRALTDYEMASRLSFFLWSSVPDDELLSLAAKGGLNKPDVLEKQVVRMLASPKASALTDNFATQWLQLKKLEIVTPDPAMFSRFQQRMRDDMMTETKTYFEYIMRENRSILELLDSNYTFVNDNLAAHYDMPGITGREFRKVTFENDRRGGVITHGSILTLTSNPTRTSPVKRGRWILEQILGTPPPPPPPGADVLPDGNKPIVGKTLRERFEMHRADPACAPCHARMDPLGFGLENFDGVGAWRYKENNLSVDSSGELPGKVTFKGPGELRKLLMEKKDQFAGSFSEKMLIYALGRGLDPSDKCATDDIVKRLKRSDYKFAEVILGVVMSEPFRMRRID